MADTAGRTDDCHRTYVDRLHPPLAAIAYLYAHQHLVGERLLHQAAETAHVVLRHETDGRPAATHGRPQPGAVVPHQPDAGRDVHHVELPDIRCHPGVLQLVDIRGVPCRKCPLRNMDSYLPATAQGIGLRTLREAGHQPKQDVPVHHLHAGNQATRLRATQALGMGRRAGGPLRGADEIAEAAADAGGGKHLHQQGEEHRDNRTGCNCCYQRADDTGYDAGGAIHHRAAELARGAADGFHLFAAGREDILGAHQRGARGEERGKRKGRKGGIPFGRPLYRDRRHRFQVRPSCPAEHIGRHFLPHPCRKGDGHRGGFGQREDYVGETDVRVLSRCGRADNHRRAGYQQL